MVNIPGYDDRDLQLRLSKELEKFVMDFVKEANGSVSSEHGVGF